MKLDGARLICRQRDASTVSLPVALIASFPAFRQTRIRWNAPASALPTPPKKSAARVDAARRLPMHRWPDELRVCAPCRPGCRLPHAAVRLPLRNRTWRGEGGNWQGAGIGSSIDFQDHRPYLPGDDPRYIDWQAYARTGHYSMKLYREEVSPRVDVALDVSESMLFDDAKRERCAGTVSLFSAESALQAGSSLRCHAVGRVG